MKYIVVAFRHDQEKSLLYRKAYSKVALLTAISQAEEKGATFLSIRLIPDDDPRTRGPGLV